MIEWKKLPRSYRYETKDLAIDVWPTKEGGDLGHRFTVYDKVKNSYLDSGFLGLSLDDTCEKVLTKCNI
jgi:hypothetical protein